MDTGKASRPKQCVNFKNYKDVEKNKVGLWKEADFKREGRIRKLGIIMSYQVALALNDLTLLTLMGINW